jgi:hypothetical protein
MRSFTIIRPMSSLKAIVMHESSDRSRVCASALLDAYCRNDARQIAEIAAEVLTIGALDSSDFAESERLELLRGIAVEVHRASSLSRTRHLDPYVKLLLHLAHPEWIESCFAHPD